MYNWQISIYWSEPSQRRFSLPSVRTIHSHKNLNGFKIINIKIQLHCFHTSVQHQVKIQGRLSNNPFSTKDFLLCQHKTKRIKLKCELIFIRFLLRCANPAVLQVFPVKPGNRNLNFCPQSSSLWPSWLSWFVRMRQTSQHSTIPTSETRARILCRKP